MARLFHSRSEIESPRPVEPNQIYGEIKRLFFASGLDVTTQFITLANLMRELEKTVEPSENSDILMEYLKNISNISQESYAAKVR